MISPDLGGKVAVVTGASGFIGSVIAKRLASAGATVIGTFIGAPDSMAALAREINETGGVCHAARCDQRRPGEIVALVDAIQGAHGRLDILVNNAAWNIRVPFEDLEALSDDIWDRILETNLRGPFLLARAFAPLLTATNGGHIVNISAVAGIMPIGSSIAYACAKAGLNHLTRCLAVAMAPKVSVNCIAPGLVENTEMSNRVMDPDTQKAARASSLLGTTSRAEDIAAQVLAFVGSRSVTGQTIAVDGGMPGAMR